MTQKYEIKKFILKILKLGKMKKLKKQILKSENKNNRRKDLGMSQGRRKKGVC